MYARDAQRQKNFDFHNYPLIISLDDTEVSQQIAFIFGQSLHPFSQHVFNLLPYTLTIT